MVSVSLSIVGSGEKLLSTDQFVCVVRIAWISGSASLNRMRVACEVSTSGLVENVLKIVINCFACSLVMRGWLVVDVLWL